MAVLLTICCQSCVALIDITVYVGFNTPCIQHHTLLFILTVIACRHAQLTCTHNGLLVLLINGEQELQGHNSLSLAV